ncbi:hypothetical protein EST38_g4512 [Candolleomyces aberdarensis]|uniref:DUF6535 domain-containing protein n=1 Tax=Candolleomyces aberdarensis TaxID=2316362 RepID=A0A4Q2DMZ5_9AGAR|nr:hypothetical protein EST38_g4512 [Candolleomyces aberdarensis]
MRIPIINHEIRIWNLQRQEILSNIHFHMLMRTQCQGLKPGPTSSTQQATLFSAVVTSFIIEAYKLLQVDQQEVASAVLLGIHRQLDNLVRQNTSAPALTPDPTVHFTPSSSAVAVNICFFLSLTLSLSTVSVGILCLQWLRKYQREPEVSPEQMIAIRHFRLRGIENWWVSAIIGLLPMVLQVSLFIFIIGLALFLFDINDTVAIVVCCVVGMTVLIHVVTSITPAFLAIHAKWHDTEDDHSLCPYRSPQAWWTRRFFLVVGWLVSDLFEGLGKLYPDTGAGSFQTQSDLETGRSSARQDAEGCPTTVQNVEANHASNLKGPDAQTSRSQLAPHSTPHSGVRPSSSWWKKIAQLLKDRLKSTDWHADDVRHVTSTRMLASVPSIRGRAWSRRGVAWGLASAPKMHRHNVLALCAMVGCIGDMEPDQWEVLLEKMDAKKSRALVLMLGGITDTESKRTPDRVMAQNLTLAYVLDYLSENNAQFRLLTLNYRFELLLRTLNQYAEDFLIVKPDASASAQVNSDNDTSARAKWWGLIKKQVPRLCTVYQFSDTNTRESIPKDLQVETFKTVHRYIEYAPWVIAEYVLVSSPLAKFWFLPLPPVEVIEHSAKVNEAILYALRMSQTHIDYSSSFVSLVHAISRKMGSGSTVSTAGEATQMPPKDYPKHMRRWENLVQRIGLAPVTEGGEGIQS